MHGNTLGAATSPYLLQHKDNPVHWRMWGPEALEEARALGRPILLSIGYAACHWCHVMAHESFENDATAAVMNKLFVNIKVDREERPDIDAIYMNALQLMGIPGGWPLTMFLTPGGEPFWGGTYFPPTPRHGQPAFVEVLQAVHKTFRDQPDTVEKNRGALKSALAALARSNAGTPPGTAEVDGLAAQVLRAVDPVNGGIGGAPKFPQAGLLELLWRSGRRTANPALAQAVILSLDHMCQGGIYDHLGGGFARYSVDARWLVPHFEKMLYDNAVLVDLLTLVWQETRSPLYAERVAETIGFVLREMRGAQGGFAASLDADSEGEEGKFYVWDIGEIISVLQREAPAFCKAYDVSETGNFEGENILNRLGTLDRFEDETEARFARNRAMLFEARAARVRPGFDDKVLSDWNGLMIAALVRAGLAFGRPDWIAAAAVAFDDVLRLLGKEEKGLRLRHSYRAGLAQHHAMADGYANLARAALRLEEATANRDYLKTAVRLVESLDRHYWDPDQGGYFYTADDAEALVTRSRFADDHPLPNANGTMIEVLARLYHRTGDESFRTRMNSLMTAFSGDLARNALALPTFVNGCDFTATLCQIVVRGASGAPDTTALLEAAHRAPLAQKSVTLIGPDEILPDTHPAAGTATQGGGATAFVCRGTICSLPLRDPEALARALSA